MPRFDVYLAPAHIHGLGVELKTRTFRPAVGCRRVGAIDAPPGAYVQFSRDVPVLAVPVDGRMLRLSAGEAWEQALAGGCDLEIGGRS